MQIVSLSPIDRLLNIHQSVKLNEVVKLNKKLLSAQLKQNEILSSLNIQIAVSSQIQRQLLQNQIIQIERQEEQKFYKSLAFCNSQILSIIESIKDEELKEYFIITYKGKLYDSFKNSQEIIVEISDKNMINNFIKRLKLLTKNLEDAKSQESSIMYEFINLLNDYQAIKLEFESNINELRNKVDKVEIPSKGIFGQNRKAVSIALAKKENLKIECKEKVLQKNEVLKHHKIHNVIFEVKKSFEDFESLSNKINNIEKTFENKFLIQPQIDLTLEQKNDKLFLDAARVIISHQKISTSLLQRKLKLGYKKAGLLMNQLESSGIISAKNKDGEILIKNTHEFEELLM